MFIKFNKVFFSYDGSDNILNDVSFHIEKSCTAVVGQNGCGKRSFWELEQAMSKISQR